MADQAKIDQTDVAILRILQAQANASIAAISHAVSLSHTPVWRRLRKLEEAGVIRERAAILDSNALGFEHRAFALLSTRVLDEDTQAEFDEMIENIPEILECHEISGERNYMIVVVARTKSDYQRLMKKTLVRLPGVTAINGLFVLRTVKQTHKIPL
ncbi:MAG: Lrp/AsnC family transcriptional regulator [Caulobacterales bacterium]|nr:Lrp/AsnC family transcriptional regulator [Caulobacterales bacterium]